MKTNYSILFLMGFFVAVTQTSYGSEPLDCKKNAEIIVAKAVGLKIKEFKKQYDVIWSETTSDGTSIVEDIQFGNGSGFIGIVMEQNDNTCVQVGEIYEGQDDQDWE